MSATVAPKPNLPAKPASKHDTDPNVDAPGAAEEDPFVPNNNEDDNNNTIKSKNSTFCCPGFVKHKDGKLDVWFHPESFRLFAYFAFWFMVMLAIVITKLFVDVDMSTTPLVEKFGYNNICINWDYSPAREVTAMFYPLVEIPLLGYIILTFFQARQDTFKQGSPVGPKFYYFCLFALPFEIILLVWFRMIFVIDAFSNVVGHTAGFQGLQVVLVIVSVQNGLYNYIRGQIFPFLKEEGYFKLSKKKGKMYTAILTLTYVAVVAVVTVSKLTIVITLFAGSPLIDGKTPEGARAAYAFDLVWMIVSAVMPIPFAIMERMTEPAIKMTIWPAQEILVLECTKKVKSTSKTSNYTPT